MLRCILLSVFILCSFGANADYIEPNERIQNYLNIRELPSRDASVIGELAKSERADLLDAGILYYYKIRLSDGTEGYAHKGYSKRVSANLSSAGNGKLGLHFIDVGQGDSTLVVCPNDKTILVDAGSLSGYSSDAVREHIVPILSEREYRIDSLVVTHPDADHYNLLTDALNEIPVGKVFYVGAYDDYSRSFSSWLRGFSNSKRHRLSTSDRDPEGEPSTTINCGEAEVYVLAASVEATKSAKNAKSIVLMIRYKEFEAILTGDATHDTEDHIIDNYPAAFLDVDLLKVGHHGSSYTSTSKDWAKAISPQIAIVSAGNRNSHGHPRQVVLNRLEPYTIEVEEHSITESTGRRGEYIWHPDHNYKEAIFTTSTSGTIVVTSGGTGFEVNTSFFKE